MLDPIAENIWSTPAPLKVFGIIALNTRMTIIRLKNHELWLHSLIPLSPELKREVDAIGTVTYLVAPSCFHHMFVADWQQEYPQAKLFAAKGLHKKREDLTIHTLFRVPKAQYWDEIEQCTIEGMPAVQEVLFFHKSSQTLIVTDFFFHMPKISVFTSLYGWYAWINGFKKRPTTPLLFKLAIKDKQAFRSSLQNIRNWKPKHIAMCHHNTYSQDDAAEILQTILDGLMVLPDIPQPLPPPS